MLKYFAFIFIGVFSLLNSSCDNHPNRAYFTINPEDRKIVIQVQINDSIETHLAFDTGTRLGTLDLDSVFCATHLDVISKAKPDAMLTGGSAWAEYHVPISYHNVNSVVKIGDQRLMYNEIQVYDWKKYFSTLDSEGLFNIPDNDTTHVWEFNFEYNYLEIHPARDFDMPKGCIICPILKGKEYACPFNIKLPITVKCADGDTITLEQTCMIDMGMGWDIALMNKNENFAFFDGRKDAVWTSYLSHYHKYCIVEATLFDRLDVDSLRIYTFKYQNDTNGDWLIGQNFLKRFNVYFDMKRSCIGLLPINNFHRVVNPIHQRFHFSYERTLQGRWLVTCVGNYATNRFKIAGLREGDEIVRINNRLPKDITWLEHRKLEVESDSIVYDIIRGKDNKRIVVFIDKNEKQGD